MPRALCALVLSFALSPSLVVAAQAQGTQPTGLPPGVFMGEADYKQAPAGTYALDPDHAAVVARVSHLRYSWSIFRFDQVSGTLNWDPVNTGQFVDLGEGRDRVDHLQRQGLRPGAGRQQLPEVGGLSRGDLRVDRLPADEHAARQGRRPVHADGQDQAGDVRRRAGRRRQGLRRPPAHRRQCQAATSIRSISACRRCSAMRSRS